MKNTLYHLHRHIKNIHGHVKKHHRKYLAGLFGGFAVVKLFALVLGLSVVEYTNISTSAQSVSGCVTTGQYYTGEYQTGGYLTGQEQTGGYFTGCTTLTGYWTGGTLDESGVLIGETWIAEESQTGCEWIVGELTGGYMTGYYLTGGYWTGGSEICDSNTGNVQTGDNQTGDNQTGNNQIPSVLSGNGICESGDVIWSVPVSGSSVRNIFSITWSYSGTDCLVSGLSLQLRDHNSQRINMSTVASGTTSVVFDSRGLYDFQHSGFYSLLGTGTSGQQLYLYTGTYTGIYTHFFTGYKVRLFTPGQTGGSETPVFTIDNELPTLTGISLLSSGSATGYLAVSGVFALRFTANEPLTGVQVIVGSGIVPATTIVSGLVYTYTRNITSLFPEGTIVANILFADMAGNTGAVLHTGLLIFDRTRPTVTGFVFSEYASGLYLSFSGSEPVRYTLTYQKSGGILSTGASSEYLTAQQLNFVGIERNQLYAFTIGIFDKAGNTRAMTGDVLWTNLGAIVPHIYMVPVTDESMVSGSLASLAVILRAEVEKFNACKNALSYSPITLTIRNNTFDFQMPLFKKTQVKTLVSAFTLFVLDKIKKNSSISSDEIAEITKKFDNFLIVLKLLRDDDNGCKQNLSNYHISQFKNALAEYKITLE